MFYRPGGSAKRVSQQLDEVYADFIGGATGWLPVCKGYWVGIQIARASINFVTASASTVYKVPQMPECTVLMEHKAGGQADTEAFPIDQWQNAVVATGRRIHVDGFIRLRILNINNADGTGVAIKVQVSRSGDVGAQT